MRLHLFHKWTKWRLVEAAGQYSRTFQMRKCVACGYVDCRVVESGYSVGHAFKDDPTTPEAGT